MFGGNMSNYLERRLEKMNQTLDERIKRKEAAKQRRDEAHKQNTKNYIDKRNNSGRNK